MVEKPCPFPERKIPEKNNSKRLAVRIYRCPAFLFITHILK
jgi:hypothetical protein